MSDSEDIVAAEAHQLHKDLLLDFGSVPPFPVTAMLAVVELRRIADALEAANYREEMKIR